MLESLELDVPPFQILSYPSSDIELRSYLNDKIDPNFFPNIIGDRIGVTIRVSLPGIKDRIRLGRHGGLHITKKEQAIESIIERFDKYGNEAKIILQHTVDAMCSGTMIKDSKSVVEAVPGDAVPLLEGKTQHSEVWGLNVFGRWVKEKSIDSEREDSQLIPSNIFSVFTDIINQIKGNAYFEWSISKKRKIFFYDFIELN